MSRRLKVALIAGTIVGALAAGGVAIAGVTGGDDGNGQPIKGDALDHASAVALEEAGGGKVTGTELRDEEGYYEVEVTRDDGSSVDVHMDRDFHVLNSKGDGGEGDGSGDDGGADDN